MVDTGVLRDMGRQRMIQALAGCIALLGLGLWYFNVTVFSYSVGEFIAAVAIIFFAVATIHWVDDEEAIEKEKKKG
jgi:uncharacterized membrane protein YidH (DUF202 family)